MCQACKPPAIPRYEGRTLILTPGTCNCLNCDVTELSDPPRCVQCNHIIHIELTDDAEAWNPLHLIDGKVVNIRPW